MAGSSELAYVHSFDWFQVSGFSGMIIDYRATKNWISGPKLEKVSGR
jgi:hypothetical protein